MLTLEVNGRQLVTESDFSCRINIKNPFFCFDEIPGPLAADISMPAKQNAAALNHPGRVTKQGKQNDRHFSGAVLHKNGITLNAGDLVIDEATSSLSGYIQNYIGKLAEELREKTLQELNISDEQTFVNKATFDQNLDLWCTIRILNKGFWKDRGKMVTESDQEVEELTVKFRDTAEYFVNQNAEWYEGVLASADTSGVAVVSPFPFLHSLFALIFKANQFYISDNFLKSDLNLRTLCLYNNYSILKSEVSTEKGVISSYSYFLNNTEEAEFNKISSSKWLLGKFYISDLLPFIELKKLMLSTQNTLNVIFVPDNNRNIRIIDRESILSGTSFDLSKYRISDWEVGERKNVALKFSWSHDDSDTAFKEVFENLDDKRDKILGSVNYKSELYAAGFPADFGDIRLVISENAYYKYGWYTITDSDEKEHNVLDWYKTSIGLQNYFFNDGDRDVENIDSDFSTLRMSDSGYPTVCQPGNCKTFSSVNKEFSPRLLFYRGNNTGGDESAAGLKLDWKGDSGLIAKRWRLTAPFLANRLPIKAKFLVPDNILYYLVRNFFQKFHDSECDFLIDEFNADPGPDNQTIVEISAYKMEDNFWAFNPGVVPGGGDGSQTEFVAKYIGANQYGKPYLISEDGKFRTTSVFGEISSASYAANNCICYYSAKKQLFVGGNDGFVHIYDLNENFRLKSVRIFHFTGSISSVRVLNGQVLVGREGTNFVYYFPVQDNIDNYSSELAAYSILFDGYNARDFEFASGYYFCCTKAGEVFRSSDLVTWSQLFDVDAEFTRLVVTDSRIYVFERSDRPFYAPLSNTSNWTEFRMTGSNEPCVIDAVASGSRVAAITDDLLYNTYIIDAPDNQVRYTPGAYAKGVFFSGSDLFVCDGAARLMRFTGTYFEYVLTLPESLKMFVY